MLVKLISVVAVLFICLIGQAQTLVDAQIYQQGDTVHLQFSGQKNWIYEIKKSALKKGAMIEVLIPALNPASINQISGFQSSLIKSVKVDQNGPDGKHVLFFETADPEIETFDYLTESPSKLIVDFFKNTDGASSLSAEERPSQSQELNKAVAVKLPPKNATITENKVSRSPATADTLLINNNSAEANSSLLNLPQAQNKIPMTFDGGDSNFERFSIKDYEIKEDSIIASKFNVYLKFPMLKTPSPFFDILQTRQPVYEITPQNNDENKQARLLKTLFDKKRFNVFLKTVTWFNEKYPDSQYAEMVQFMKADALFAMWLESRNADQFDLAMLEYRQALKKYPESKLAERTMMLMGFATLERGDFLGTLRQFQSHMRKRPQSPNRDIARFAISEAYEKINRFDDALQGYNEIEQDASKPQYRERAAFLRGDVYYKKGDHHQAIQEYQQALKKYPLAAAEFPNAIYNLASAQFETKDYRNSLENFRKFLIQFSERPEAGYAMTRVGEILDILGADKSRVNGTYMETSFRYGDTPASAVAQLRMLSERMALMKPKEVEKAISDIQELAKKSDLPGMPQFAVLMKADGFASRKEFPKAIDLLVKFYQENPTTADTDLLSSRIVQNIYDKLADDVQNEKYIDALKWHNQFADTWLKNSNRIDTQFQIGKAFEQAGVFKDSEKLYEEALNKIYAMKGTREGREGAILQDLPSEDRLNLRLAAVQNQLGKPAAAYRSIINIKSPEKLSQNEQIERVQLAATLLEKRGENQSAIRYLTELLKEWSGIPELVAEPYLKLAQLEMKTGNEDQAVLSLNKIDTLMNDSKKVPAVVHEKSLQLLADIYLKRKSNDLAATSIQRLLDQYGATRPLASYRYKLGQIFFEQGQIQKASDTWNELKSEQNQFWYKLAREKLQSSQWNEEYNRYIKRIPAMATPTPENERK